MRAWKAVPEKIESELIHRLSLNAGASPLNFRYWHLADDRGAASFCPLLDRADIVQPLIGYD